MINKMPIRKDLEKITVEMKDAVEKTEEIQKKSNDKSREDLEKIIVELNNATNKTEAAIKNSKDSIERRNRLAARMAAEEAERKRLEEEEKKRKEARAQKILDDVIKMCANRSSTKDSINSKVQELKELDDVKYNDGEKALKEFESKVESQKEEIGNLETELKDNIKIEEKLKEFEEKVKNNVEDNLYADNKDDFYTLENNMEKKVDTIEDEGIINGVIEELEKISKGGDYDGKGTDIVNIKKIVKATIPVMVQEVTTEIKDINDFFKDTSNDKFLGVKDYDLTPTGIEAVSNYINQNSKPMENEKDDTKVKKEKNKEHNIDILNLILGGIMTQDFRDIMNTKSGEKLDEKLKHLTKYLDIANEFLPVIKFSPEENEQLKKNFEALKKSTEGKKSGFGSDVKKDDDTKVKLEFIDTLNDLHMSLKFAMKSTEIAMEILEEFNKREEKYEEFKKSLENKSKKERTKIINKKLLPYNGEFSFIARKARRKKVRKGKIIIKKLRLITEEDKEKLINSLIMLDHYFNNEGKLKKKPESSIIKDILDDNNEKTMNKRKKELKENLKNLKKELKKTEKENFGNTRRKNKFGSDANMPKNVYTNIFKQTSQTMNLIRNGIEIYKTKMEKTIEGIRLDLDEEGKKANTGRITLDLQFQQSFEDKNKNLEEQIKTFKERIKRFKEAKVIYQKMTNTYINAISEDKDKGKIDLDIYENIGLAYEYYYKLKGIHNKEKETEEYKTAEEQRKAAEEEAARQAEEEEERKTAELAIQAGGNAGEKAARNAPRLLEEARQEEAEQNNEEEETDGFQWDNDDKKSIKVDAKVDVMALVIKEGDIMSYVSSDEKIKYIHIQDFTKNEQGQPKGILYSVLEYNEYDDKWEWTGRDEITKSNYKKYKLLQKETFSKEQAEEEAERDLSEEEASKSAQADPECKTKKLYGYDVTTKDCNEENKRTHKLKYRELMRKYHTDKGGADKVIAQKINSCNKIFTDKCNNSSFGAEDTKKNVSIKEIEKLIEKLDVAKDKELIESLKKIKKELEGILKQEEKLDEEKSDFQKQNKRVETTIQNVKNIRASRINEKDLGKIKDDSEILKVLKTILEHYFVYNRETGKWKFKNTNSTQKNHQKIIEYFKNPKYLILSKGRVMSIYRLEILQCYAILENLRKKYPKYNEIKDKFVNDVGEYYDIKELKDKELIEYDDEDEEWKIIKDMTEKSPKDIVIEDPEYIIEKEMKIVDDQLELKMKFLNVIMEKYKKQAEKYDEDATKYKEIIKAGKNLAVDENEKLKVPFDRKIKVRMKKFVNIIKSYNEKTEQEILKKRVEHVNKALPSHQILAKNLKKLNIRKTKDYSAFNKSAKDFSVNQLRNEIPVELYDKLAEIKAYDKKKEKSGFGKSKRKNRFGKEEERINKLRAETSSEMSRIIKNKLGQDPLSKINPFKSEINEGELKSLLKGVVDEKVRDKMEYKIQKAIKHTKPTSLEDLSRKINKDTKELTKNTNSIYDKVKNLVTRVNKKDKRIIQLKNELEKERTLGITKLTNTKENFELNRQRIEKDLNRRNAELENIKNDQEKQNIRLYRIFNDAQISDKNKLAACLKALNEAKVNNVKEIDNLRESIRKDYDRKLANHFKSIRLKHEQELQRERNKLAEAKKEGENKIKAEVAKALHTTNQYKSVIRQQEIKYTKLLEEAKKKCSEKNNKIDEVCKQKILELKTDYKNFEKSVVRIFEKQKQDNEKQINKIQAEADKETKKGSDENNEKVLAYREEIKRLKEVATQLNTRQNEALKQGIQRREAKIKDLRQSAIKNKEIGSQKLAMTEKQIKQELQNKKNEMNQQLKDRIELNKQKAALDTQSNTMKIQQKANEQVSTIQTNLNNEVNKIEADAQERIEKAESETAKIKEEAKKELDKKLADLQSREDSLLKQFNEELDKANAQTQGKENEFKKLEIQLRKQLEKEQDIINKRKEELYQKKAEADVELVKAKNNLKITEMETKRDLEKKLIDAQDKVTNRGMEQAAELLQTDFDNKVLDFNEKFDYEKKTEEEIKEGKRKLEEEQKEKEELKNKFEEEKELFKK